MFEIKRTRINQTNEQLNEQTIYLEKKEEKSTMINRDSKIMEELQMQYVCVRVFHFSDYLVFKHTCKHIL